MNAQLWSEFLTVAGFHALAVASPGPDFAIVVRQSVSYGRRTGMVTALGVGSAILIHVTYSLLGIGLLIKSSPWAFDVLKYVAAIYLIYLGWHALTTKAVQRGAIEDFAPSPPQSRQAFKVGFLTNGLNPKATLFFFALFTAVIQPTTPLWAQAGYGLYMAVATALWFIFVANLFGHRRVRLAFERMGHWFDRFMGVALIALGLKLASASLG